ncbi:response regulator [Agromyces atrinae]|uniref:DNA-binding response OmpR family regulator n=1 Tax=Agromyces atrinae TaxID=592376 RepID=A0A852S9W6_9MICO|nr:response regulator [Agromyces atrinae]MCI2959180.1 response regulator [Agromyces atrinae]NYD65604.1 DNA-binding response OmpR family regulator [Agromyces atrinae]
MTAARVIIADDDPDIRGLLEIAARKAGLEIVSSHGDGASALASALANDPDLMLLDVAMPEMNGVDVARELRSARDDGRPRVLMVSASVDATSQAAGVAAGADDYVMKPFSLRVLVERLKSIVADE